MDEDKVEPPKDPFLYIGRVHRDPETGWVTSMEVFHDTPDKIKIEEGDEFITFTTNITLEDK